MYTNNVSIQREVQISVMDIKKETIKYISKDIINLCVIYFTDNDESNIFKNKNNKTFTMGFFYGNCHFIISMHS